MKCEHECCANCIYCHKTKELTKEDWVEYYICTFYVEEGKRDNKDEPVLLTLGNQVHGFDDLCVYYTSKDEYLKDKEVQNAEIQETIDDLEYLTSPGCTDTQHDYYDEIRNAIKYLKSMLKDR